MANRTQVVRDRSVNFDQTASTASHKFGFVEKVWLNSENLQRCFAHLKEPSGGPSPYFVNHEVNQCACGLRQVAVGHAQQKHAGAKNA